MDERIVIVQQPIDPSDLAELAATWNGTMVKGVADIERGVLALGGEWHMDANNVLLENGSSQQNLWGFNVYPDEGGAAAIEYISLINIRPHQGNHSMELSDEKTRQKIYAIARALIPSIEL